MKTFLKKLILLALFAGCSATLLLPWVNYSDVQALDGTSVLTGNLFLTLIIFGAYGISVLFYQKATQVFFCVGLSSLSMLFAIMFSRFEEWGRFANKCVGPYIGLTAVLVTIAVYVWLNCGGKRK